MCSTNRGAYGAASAHPGGRLGGKIPGRLRPFGGGGRLRPELRSIRSTFIPSVWLSLTQP
ncbi:hypothetical protein WMF28_15170 [Sorangium sp. So ce590]|uniref:hypothetical protein n=1 Tax=Sorangium sp. So ce590 TaxID=3133317 RepID=UPI003F63F2B3